ncbi:DUF6415 family natural product biosynthesis protein [Streptomyces sp. NPDC088755]|uniref:DUF6415 family natural product biosynthesis protein n=1 Tax=Streptomyces sp. NPDC088755 TaxID=3365888 RepID=UPI0037F73ED6
MRLPLTSHLDAGPRDAPSGQGGTDGAPGTQRDPAVAAAETVALVLEEDSPLPETAADVMELARRLHGHISQLGAIVPSRAYALSSAQQLASVGVPDGHVPSRVDLVKLAEATQELVVSLRTHGVAPVMQTRGRRWLRPRINVLRGSVFAIALVCLVLAASVPRT